MCYADINLYQLPNYMERYTLLGRVVRKPISANPGLKANREFNFFGIKVFLLFMFCED